MDSPVLVRIVEAVADAKGVDPTKVETPIPEHVDTEAIRLLAAHETASWTLSFELPDHNVTVTSDGLVLVDGAQKEVWV